MSRSRMEAHIALVVICLGTLADAITLNTTSASRHGKVFSLFNVVSFKNGGCQSTQAISGGGTTNPRRNGTCLTASECMTQKGTAAGGCAAGFGVCCVFTFTASGSTVTQNCSYIQNPGFPTGLIPTATTATTMYTINKLDSSICSLRLDFEALSLLGLDTTNSACQDTFTVTTGSSPSNVPVICGVNTGQHMYIDFGSSTSVNLAIALLATSTTARSWDIKVSQIPCNTLSRRPNSCLQYFEDVSGRFTTFDFTGTTPGLLPNQRYSACIRQAKGFCCIEYKACDGTTASFTLKRAINAAIVTALQDSNCITDPIYIGVPGSSSMCSTGTVPGLATSNLYCGTALSSVAPAGAAVPFAPVCDCTEPFKLDVFVLNPTTPAQKGLVAQSVGACISWMQLPCD